MIKGALTVECSEMWEVKNVGVVACAVPILGVIGFLGAAFTVFAGILNSEEMGVSENVLRMFGVGEIIMAICWVMVFFGLRAGSSWTQPLACLATGIYICNYLVSLAMFKNMGDSLFKYWGTSSAVVLSLYCIWI